jgi:hypothetical protein
VCADVREDGPWWFAVATVAAAQLLVRAQGSVLMVDTNDNSEFACSLAVDTATRDELAYTIADVIGFWGEVFVARDGAVSTIEQAIALVTEQLRVMVTSAKWPRTAAGEPKNRSKVCFKALLDGKVAPLHPPSLIVRGAGTVTPVRYRLQADFFPLQCAKCHYVLLDCHCAQYAAEGAKRREERMERDAERIRGRGRTTAGGGSSTDPPPPSQAERMAVRRAQMEVIARCKAQGICVFWTTGKCTHAPCRDKHEVRASQPTPHSR